MAEEAPSGAPVAAEAPKMPRWVMTFVVVAVVLVVVFVILHLAGVGPTGHGP